MLSESSGIDHQNTRHHLSVMLVALLFGCWASSPSRASTSEDLSRPPGAAVMDAVPPKPVPIPQPAPKTVQQPTSHSTPKLAPSSVPSPVPAVAPKASGMKGVPPAMLAPAQPPASPVDVGTSPAVASPSVEVGTKINVARERAKEIMQRAEQVASELSPNLDGEVTQPTSSQVTKAQGASQGKENDESLQPDAASSSVSALELLKIRQLLEEDEDRQHPEKTNTKDKADIRSGEVLLPHGTGVRLPPME